MSALTFHVIDQPALLGRLAPLPTGRARAGGPDRFAVDTVTIDRRLNGPRRAANGGFAAGTIARHVDADVVTVALRRPVPLGRALDVVTAGRGGIEVIRGRRVVAEAAPGVLDDGPAPVPPTFADAVAARAAHPLVGIRHPLSDCVVCGPARSDGMGVTPGPVPGRPDLLAAPWVVGAETATAGLAHFPAVWGAMDCTSYPAAALRSRELCLLGTMTASVERRPHVGEELVVYSWTREHHGRRYETSVRLVDAGGDTVARADATWIALRRQRRALPVPAGRA
ncbi:hypothetical protein FVP74_10540 [Microbacterium saccharophilum]|uniref:Thioesterase family protein n=1 Tax=Microbacterium saccharophilum TaxID=1213358 RepID=A0A5C8HX94_9MICO|nr:hypothetical protein [Microbacterium saccharophilum]TXK10759.1 hypothetical protein FVP74_10540 [Microbacterium saccharophilum]GEP48884.1 hypothetical protein MSA03_23920 [Microbacterium saccharophilum]